MQNLIKPLLAASALALAGCVGAGCTSSGPVHPTDGQIKDAPAGGATQDPPYTPWWAEQEAAVK